MHCRAASDSRWPGRDPSGRPIRPNSWRSAWCCGMTPPTSCATRCGNLPAVTARRGISSGKISPAGSAPGRRTLTWSPRFAAAHGLAVVEAQAARRTVVLSGTVAAFDDAFGVALQRFEHPAGSYRGRTGPVHLPDVLTDAVEAVLGLDNRPVARSHISGNGGKPVRQPRNGADGERIVQPDRSRLAVRVPRRRRQGRMRGPHRVGRRLRSGRSAGLFRRPGHQPVARYRCRFRGSCREPAHWRPERTGR